MVRVADWSFLGGGMAGSCDDDAHGHDGLALHPSASTIGNHSWPGHQSTHLVAVNMANADLKYYELYRRSRYCVSIWESLELAG
jgi:hypothetical protein